LKTKHGEGGGVSPILSHYLPEEKWNWIITKRKVWLFEFSTMTTYCLKQPT
jgi:hypothetical protein